MELGDDPSFFLQALIKRTKEVSIAEIARDLIILAVMRDEIRSLCVDIIGLTTVPLF
jgi:hypothetical protein